MVDVDDPSGPGVMVEVLSSSICGTDLGLVDAGLTGFTIGHEFAGLVDGVPHAVDPSISCGSCDQCRDGHTQRCVGPHTNLGIFVDGGLCDRIIVPASNLVPLPAGLSVEDACLVEPAGVAWHGARRAAIVPGERVAVVGGGSIGLLAVAAVRHLGHDVALVAPSPTRTRPVSASEPSVPAAPSTSCSKPRAASRAWSHAPSLLAPADVSSCWASSPPLLPFPARSTLVKELSWIGAMAYGRHRGLRDLDEAAALLAASPDIRDAIITHRFSLEESPEAFRVAASRSHGSIKVGLYP